MKATTIVGIVLVVIGIVGLLYGGISFTRREKVLDIGPIEATAERRKTIPLPPVIGGLFVAGGIALIVVGLRR